jgi:capsular exopolysaccharide synthesis family protein
MQMLARDWHSMAVTAAGSSEGKSTTAINIAISLARDISTWVYLVDLDLQRPKLATYLGLRFDKGLSDYLAGSAEFQDILYNPGVERLVVIPNAQPMENSSDLLGSTKMSKLCQLLASEVPRPIVIFDLPPLFMSDDVLKFQQNADCTLLVVSEGITSRKMLERANEMLQKMNLIGVVLNRSSEREDSGYY